MGQTLEHGIFLPDEGERNCYSGLAENWVALDTLVGAYSSHYQNTTIHVTASDKQTWNEHVADTVKHVTASDKQTWNGKQDALSQTQLDAVNSGIDSSKVQQIATNTSDISSLQSGKANDSDVVHKSGNETIGGSKTFSATPTIYNSDVNKSTPNLYLQNQLSEKGNTANPNSQRIVFADKNTKRLSQIQVNKGSSGETSLNLRVETTDNSNNDINSQINYYITKTGTKNFVPNADNDINLGGSSLKWKNIYSTNINGVEPSSLSLPSGKANNVIDISSYITNLDGTANSYTVPANGWISIAVVGTAIAIVSSSWSDSRLRASSGDVRMLYPVLKNETLDISVTGTTLAYARFIPCQGNV